MNGPDTLTFREVVLHKVRVGVSTVMSADLIDDLTLRQDVTDIAANTIVAQLRAHVTASKSETTYDTEHVKVPLTWWDHLKADLVVWVHERFGWRWDERIQPRWLRIATETSHTIYYACPHTMLHEQKAHIAWLAKAPTEGPDA